MANTAAVGIAAVDSNGHVGLASGYLNMFGNPASDNYDEEDPYKLSTTELHAFGIADAGIFDATPAESADQQFLAHNDWADWQVNQREAATPDPLPTYTPFAPQATLEAPEAQPTIDQPLSEPTQGQEALTEVPQPTITQEPTVVVEIPQPESTVEEQPPQPTEVTDYTVIPTSVPLSSEAETNEDGIDWRSIGLGALSALGLAGLYSALRNRPTKHETPLTSEEERIKRLIDKLIPFNREDLVEAARVLPWISYGDKSKRLQPVEVGDRSNEELARYLATNTQEERVGQFARGELQLEELVSGSGKLQPIVRVLSE